tara:strand:- start:588 stop:899 length:312 start_codon:yes stop_codon:yes gene_type:complete
MDCLNKKTKKSWGLVHMDETSKLYWSKKMQQEDKINSPNHYTQGKIEVIDFIIDQKMGYLTASAIKYLCRWEHKHKGDGQIDDLRKARFFIEKQIEELLKEES